MFMIYIRYKGIAREQELRIANDLNSAIQSAKLDFAMRENVGFMEYGDIEVLGHKA